MSDHKPCPFCGFSDTSACIENESIGKRASVTCNICGATVYGVGIMGEMAGAVPPDDLLASAYRAWNTREEPRS